MNICDVIGCARPAAWVYDGVPDINREPFLCNVCWRKLRRMHPEQAEVYGIYDYERATPDIPVASDDDDIIVIG